VKTIKTVRRPGRQVVLLLVLAAFSMISPLPAAQTLWGVQDASAQMGPPAPVPSLQTAKKRTIKRMKKWFGSFNKGVTVKGLVVGTYARFITAGVSPSNPVFGCQFDKDMPNSASCRGRLVYAPNPWAAAARMPCFRGFDYDPPDIPITVHRYVRVYLDPNTGKLRTQMESEYMCISQMM
jgi:hypothetical protein